MMSKKDLPRAVVLLSGGMDSAVTLALAQQQFECFGLSIDYRQRHRAELDAASTLAKQFGVVHRVVAVDLRTLGGSALTDDRIAVPDAVPGAQPHIPSTYVPARNTIMLSVALGYAEVLGAQAIFTGVNAVDFSGYPDCRPVFVDAYERLANVATKAAVEGKPLRVHAPLIAMSKADIVRTGVELGLDFSATVSCYQANDKGEACGHCDACHLRREGFRQAGVVDCTRYWI